MAPLLQVENLVAGFETPKGFLKAVDGVSFQIAEGESVGLVGESGCGKSASALSILQLLPHPIGKITEGKILYQGRDLLELPTKELCAIRGKEIAMIFQEPMSALNPVMRLGEQIAEPLLIHKLVQNKADAKAQVLQMLERVGIPEPHRRFGAYPHELSGGQRQRALIAMALITRPKLIIADEPTTALDATLQTQILELLASLQKEFALSVLFITHDLGLVKKLCHRVNVMYAGQIVESAPCQELFSSPKHPYSAGLLASRIGENDTPKGMLKTIEGRLPGYFEWESGCRFRPRCPYAAASCQNPQPLRQLATRCLRCELNPLKS